MESEIRGGSQVLRDRQVAGRTQLLDLVAPPQNPRIRLKPDLGARAEISSHSGARVGRQGFLTGFPFAAQPGTLRIASLGPGC
jgi:hypothetical protein